jgi:hypothetical protein
VIDTQRLELLDTVPTELDAHTIGWHPDCKALYAFLPSSQGASVFLDS